jgi:hypothetical protein
VIVLLRGSEMVDSVNAMNPRIRRIVLVVLGVLLVGGLILCGPAHHALHADQHGVDCDSCSLVGVGAPAPVYVLGPVSVVRWRCVIAAPEVVSAPSITDGYPRGPPSVS